MNNVHFFNKCSIHFFKNGFFLSELSSNIIWGRENRLKISPFLLNLEKDFKNFWNHSNRILPFVNSSFKLSIKCSWLCVWKNNHMFFNNVVKIICLSDLVILLIAILTWNYISRDISNWVLLPSVINFIQLFLNSKFFQCIFS